MSEIVSKHNANGPGQIGAEELTAQQIFDDLCLERYSAGALSHRALAGKLTRYCSARLVTDRTCAYIIAARLEDINVGYRDRTGRRLPGLSTRILTLLPELRAIYGLLQIGEPYGLISGSATAHAYPGSGMIRLSRRGHDSEVD